MSNVVTTVASSRTPWLMKLWLVVPYLDVNTTLPYVCFFEAYIPKLVYQTTLKRIHRIEDLERRLSREYGFDRRLFIANERSHTLMWWKGGQKLKNL